jgi:hypothetical protein
MTLFRVIIKKKKRIIPSIKSQVKSVKQLKQVKHKLYRTFKTDIFKYTNIMTDRISSYLYSNF